MQAFEKMLNKDLIRQIINQKDIYLEKKNKSYWINGF